MTPEKGAPVREMETRYTGLARDLDDITHSRTSRKRGGAGRSHSSQAQIIRPDIKGKGKGLPLRVRPRNLTGHLTEVCPVPQQNRDSENTGLGRVFLI